MRSASCTHMTRFRSRLQAQRTTIFIRRLPPQRHDLCQLSQDAGLQLSRYHEAEGQLGDEGRTGSFPPLLRSGYFVTRAAGGLSCTTHSLTRLRLGQDFILSCIMAGREFRVTATKHQNAR